MRRRKPQASIISSGDQLVEDYKTALTTLSTAEGLKAHAEMSEDKALGHIASIKPGNEVYVTPQDVPEEFQKALAHHSLNAHFQKIQAEQVSGYAQANLAELEQEVKRKYEGRRVTVKVLEPKLKPLALQLRDRRSGRLYFTPSRAKSVTGTIRKIDLAADILVLKPSLVTKTFNSGIQAYYLMVIDPQTLQPAIRVGIRS